MIAILDVGPEEVENILAILDVVPEEVENILFSNVHISFL